MKKIVMLTDLSPDAIALGCIVTLFALALSFMLYLYFFYVYPERIKTKEQK